MSSLHDKSLVKLSDHIGIYKLIEDLGELFNSEHSSDVTFIVGTPEVKFYAHKLIIQLRCRSIALDSKSVLSDKKQKILLSYPTFDCVAFKEVLYYIYTGFINLVENRLVDLMIISVIFGMKDLLELCELCLADTLNVNNACFFYVKFLEVLKRYHQQTNITNTMENCLNICVKYIEENAEQIVKTNSWLLLDKEALVILLKSDNFGLDEGEVWRAVISWVRYKASIDADKHASQWNDHEKRQAKSLLQGVIENIKLLLIDSKIFAEEVEPTGTVPMEVSLERYRLAAVPDKVKLTNEWYLKPRISHKFFCSTIILNDENQIFQRLLNEWFGKSNQMWKLLFRASKNGFSAKDFHSLCDGHSPTFCIIIGVNGSISGGFSDIPWTSKTSAVGKFIPSQNSFLFTLVNHQGVPPSIFRPIIPHYATMHHPDAGPIFGAGADLFIGNNCNHNMDSYSNMPHSYDGENASSSILMGDYNFKVVDYEIFTPLNSL